MNSTLPMKLYTPTHTTKHSVSVVVLELGEHGKKFTLHWFSVHFMISSITFCLYTKARACYVLYLSISNTLNQHQSFPLTQSHHIDRVTATGTEENNSHLNSDGSNAMLKLFKCSDKTNSLRFYWAKLQDINYTIQQPSSFVRHW